MEALFASLSAAAQATARTVAAQTQTLSYGELVKIQGSGGALAMSGQRDKLYAIQGAQYLLPLHRMMSSNDLYAQVDGQHGT